MKRLLIAICLVLSLGVVQAQDVVVIKHTNYTTHYSKSLHYPVLVEWWETKAKSKCTSKLPRKDNFQPDPQLTKDTSLRKDYLGSGLDRGHMSPANVNECSGQAVLDECFYFSNMAPQYHSFNAGDWATLEAFTSGTSLVKDSVHVWAGSLGVAKKIGTTSVPKQCWKVVYVKKTKTYLAYLFTNDTIKPDGIANNATTVARITKLTGFKFK
jgi:DNA/RNA endonuclease G (NUC1)